MPHGGAMELPASVQRPAREGGSQAEDAAALASPLPQPLCTPCRRPARPLGFKLEACTCEVRRAGGDVGARGREVGLAAGLLFISLAILVCHCSSTTPRPTVMPPVLNVKKLIEEEPDPDGSQNRAATRLSPAPSSDGQRLLSSSEHVCFLDEALTGLLWPRLQDSFHNREQNVVSKMLFRIHFTRERPWTQIEMIIWTRHSERAQVDEPVLCCNEFLYKGVVPLFSH